MRSKSPPPAGSCLNDTQYRRITKIVQAFYKSVAGGRLVELPPSSERFRKNTFYVLAPCGAWAFKDNGREISVLTLLKGTWIMQEKPSINGSAYSLVESAEYIRIPYDSALKKSVCGVHIVCRQEENDDEGKDG